jgi:hypothetical protein
MLSRNRVLWLVPILVTIHNLEEALLMPAFLQARNESIPGSLRDLLPPVTYRQFLIALLIVTVIPYLITLFGNPGRAGGIGVYLLLGFLVVMLINVAAHVFMAVIIGGYAPGIVTALLMNLPFSVYLLRRALRERWVTGREMGVIFVVGLIVHGVGLPGLIIVAGSI